MLYVGTAKHVVITLQVYASIVQYTDTGNDIRATNSDAPAETNVSDLRIVAVRSPHAQSVRSVIGNDSVPIQLAQCRFSGLAASSAKILIYIYIYIFSNKICGRNFIKQHTETVMV